ncbi:MAG: hypothetical protein ACO39X_04040 [Candidatus Nanopelagicaceae bacterium]|jgi:hypothetical protein
MEETLLALLRRRIAESKENVEQFLASGGADSMEKYNRIVGRYEAMTMIEEELLDLERRYIES